MCSRRFKFRFGIMSLLSLVVGSSLATEGSVADLSLVPSPSAIYKAQKEGQRMGRHAPPAAVALDAALRKRRASKRNPTLAKAHARFEHALYNEDSERWFQHYKATDRSVDRSVDPPTKLLSPKSPGTEHERQPHAPSTAKRSAQRRPERAGRVVAHSEPESPKLPQV